MTYLYILAGAAAGAPLRYFLGSQVQSRLAGAFPWGTFAVNASGCLLIGLVLGWAEARGSLSRETRLLLVTGFLGSYTTFSAFAWETYSLAKAGDMTRSVAYVLLSVVLGLAATWGGAALGRTAA